MIEWPEKAGAWLPKNIFKITITAADDSRVITVETASEDQSKRLEQIK